MISALIGILPTVLRWIIIVPLFVTVLLAFMILFNSVLTVINVGINASFLGDISALVQIWLPFNLTPTFNWLMGLCVLIVAYKLGTFVYDLFNGFFKGN